MPHTKTQLGGEGHSVFKRIEARYPWGVIGLAATVILGLPAIFLTLRELTPRVTIEVLSIANVFDVYRPLPELTVVFKGENIQESGKNVRIVTLSLTNLGEKNVVQGDFDQDQPFGFTISGAQIVGEPRIIKADSTYLTNQLKPKVTASGTISFNKVILEKSQGLTFELVILQDKNAALEITPSGKISGQRDILITDRTSEGQIGFWGKLLQGGIQINIFRFLLAVLLFIALIVLIVVLVSSLQDWKSARRKNRADKYMKKIAQFLAVDSETQTKLSDVFAATTQGPAGLKDLVEFLQTPEGLQKIKMAREELKTYEDSVKAISKGHQFKTVIKPTEHFEKIKYRRLAEHYDWLLTDGPDGPAANPRALEILSSVYKISQNVPPPKDADWSRKSNARYLGLYGPHGYYPLEEEVIQGEFAKTDSS